MTLKDLPFTAAETADFPPGYGENYYANGMDGGKESPDGRILRWFCRVKSPSGSLLEGRGRDYAEARAELVRACHAHATLGASVQACSDGTAPRPTADDFSARLDALIADAMAGLAGTERRLFLDVAEGKVYSASCTHDFAEADARKGA